MMEEMAFSRNLLGKGTMKEYFGKMLIEQMVSKLSFKGAGLGSCKALALRNEEYRLRFLIFFFFLKSFFHMVPGFMGV